jgi:HAD superfamily hydrolase (TIGR01509 family)
MIKPEKEIYIYTLEKNSLKPEDVVFIDDSQKNVDGGKKVGIDSILFQNTDQLRQDLKKFGI